MGNYRFRLSDMMPNAWFYKLRDMSKTKTTNNHHKKPPNSSYHPPSTTTPPPPHHHISQPRTSFYYTPKLNQSHNPKFPHFHDPPRKSSRKSKPHRKTIYKPSPKSTPLTESTQSQTLQDFFHSPTTTSPHDPNSLSPSSESTQSGLATASWCTSCRVSSSTSDIIIDINDKWVAKKIDNPSGFHFSPEIDLKLPPIITKPAKPTSRNPISGKKPKETTQTPARKSATGVKLRPNSPKVALSNRIASKKKKTTLSESFAIVKSSFDPQKDFMVSMMEMIVENNIRESKDLEDLLACYLSLNSDEYHDVIVKAFEQIWFSLPDV